MTSSQPRYHDRSPEFGCSSAGESATGELKKIKNCNWPPQYGQPAQLAPPPQFGRSPQFVPPPRFGRLPHNVRSNELTPAQVSTSLGAQPWQATWEAAPQAVGLHPALAAPVPPQHGSATDLVAPRVSLDDADGRQAIDQVPGPLADFGSRTISFLVDYVAPAIVLNLLLSIAAVVGSPAWRPAMVVVGSLVLLSFLIWNSCHLQGTTGRSLGRRMAKTSLVTVQTGRPLGFGLALVRQICHVLEFGVGFLWPLWDGRRQTFADKIVDTVVIRADGSTEDRSSHRPS